MSEHKQRDHFFVRDGFRFDQPSPAVERIRQLLESGHGIMIFPHIPPDDDDTSRRSRTVVAWMKYESDGELTRKFGASIDGVRMIIPHQSIKLFGENDSDESRLVEQVLDAGFEVYLAPEFIHEGSYFTYRTIHFVSEDI